ncbi:MAG: MarR family transcriptional regulator [Polyangiaceae bacterium]
MARPRIYALLQRAQQATKRRADHELLQAVGITAAQLGVLFCLEARPEQQQQQLARSLGVAKSAITSMVARLEAESLVARRSAPGDARAFQLALTPEGKARVARARHVHRRLNAELYAGFSDAELELVARFLRRASLLGDRS